MKLKYYLRGLGIGILLTTVILSISFHTTKAQLSDAEIIKKAEQLGMERKDTDDDILSPAAEAEPLTADEATIEPGDSSETKEDAAEKPETTEEPSTEQTVETTEEPAAEQKPDTTEEPAAEQKPDTTEETTGSIKPAVIDPGEDSDNKSEDTKNVSKTEVKYITVEIEKGMASENIVALLKSKGVIHKDKLFNQYLIDYGYARKIKYGTFQLPIDGSYKELVAILTN